jgi:hypothetical protein
MNPELSDFDDLHWDRSPEPELRAFGHLAKLIAQQAYRYRIEDQGLLLARICEVAAYHMGRDPDALWIEIERHHAELRAMVEHGNDSGVTH